MKFIPKYKSRPLKNGGLIHGRFAKVNLAVFALVFAGIGGYLIFSSFAAGSSIMPRFVNMAWYPGWETNITVTSPAFPWSDLNELDNFGLETQTASPYLHQDSDSSMGVNAAEQNGFVKNTHDHNVLAMLTIGGASDLNWGTACASGNVSAFASAIVGQLTKYGYDGVDLDIEDNSLLNNLSLQNSCVQAVYNAVKAVTISSANDAINAGKAPLLSGDVGGGWAEPSWSGVVSLLDQINIMTYDSFCVPVSGATNCVSKTGAPSSESFSPQQYIARETGSPSQGYGGAPIGKLVFGIEDEDESYTTHNNYSTLATLSGNATSSSIPVSSLANAIPAGSIVLATTENPPTYSQVLTTTGASAGATSIPIAGSPTLNHAYASGALVLSDYLGPPDCGNIAAYVKSQGLLGTATWTAQADASHHNGRSPCLDASGSVIVIISSNPAPTVTLNPNPSSISSGSSSILTWTSANATNCAAVAPSGWTSKTTTNDSQSVSPTTTTTYTISCTGSGGTAQQSVTITAGSAIVGDINGDGHVTITDLSILLSSYGSPNAACVTVSQYNCSLSGTLPIGIIDLSILLSHFGV